MISTGGLHQVEPLERTFDRYPDELPEMDLWNCTEDFIRGVLHNVNGYLQNLYMLSEILQDGQQKQDKYARTRCSDARSEWDKLSADQQRRLENLRKQTDGLADRLQDLMLLTETETREKDVQLNDLLARLVDVFRGDLLVRHRVRVDFQPGDGLPRVQIQGREFVTAMIHTVRYALAGTGDALEKLLTVRSRYEAGIIRVDFRVEVNKYDYDQDCAQFPEPADPVELRWPSGAVKSHSDKSNPKLDFPAVQRLLSSHGVRVRTESSPEGTFTVLEIPTAARARQVV